MGGQRFFDIWGPALRVWEGHAADSQVRYEGSSGGVATALSLFALERSGMHGVLHVRSRLDVPYLNETVFSKTRQELLAGAGSRYAPASPCDSLELIEHAPGPCVFVGKPCDVAALRKAMELRPKLQEKVGLTIAFFCAGTPSTLGTVEMLKQMGIADPASVVCLRYRGRGWPGMATAEFRDSEGVIKQRQLNYEQSWGDILQKYRQWRCYICPDHVGEFADISVADAWHRSLADNQPGLSVMIARTVRGKEVLEQMCLSHSVEGKAVPAEVLWSCRPGQAAHQGGLWTRTGTLKAMNIPTPKYRGFRLFKLWRCEFSIKDTMRSLLGTGKRVFVKELFRRHDPTELIVKRRI